MTRGALEVVPGAPSSRPLRTEPMPRRAPLGEATDAPRLTPTRMSDRVGGHAGAWRTLLRIFAWSRALLYVQCGIALDTLTGRAAASRHAERQQRWLQRLGPFASRIGMQLSMRLDLFSLETCNAFARLDDAMGPIPLDAALAAIERSVRRPLGEVFATIDPEPILSDSVQCSYQALLRSDDGAEQKVVVKVRRPGAADAFATELAALSFLLGFLEAATLARAGLFRNLRVEVREMVLGELDFVGIARYHRLFRRRARRAGLHWVQAARVYSDLSDPDVLVSEFVAGVWCSEVVAAVESGDPGAAAELVAKDVDPEVIARRLLHVAWWSLFENYFFYVDPRPSRIVVRPGNRIVFINLGNCGHAPEKNRQLQLRTLQCLARDDVSAAVEAMIQWIAPLPFIDVDDFAKTVEGRVWGRLFALQDRDAPWADRTTVGVWRALLRTMRDFGVTARLEVVHAMRSEMLFDVVAARLHPKLDLLKEFGRYERRARRRSARAFVRRLRKAAGSGVLEFVLARMEALERAADRLGFFVDTVTRNLPVEFSSVSKKSAYAASVLLSIVAWSTAAITLAAGGTYAFQWASNQRIDAFLYVRMVVFHPAFSIALLVVALGAIRRIRMRLDDKDPE